MAPISNNFNVLSVAGNQNLMPSVASSISWFHTNFIIWMWVSTSEDVDQAKALIDQRRKQATVKAQKCHVAERIEQQPVAPATPRCAPGFR